MILTNKTVITACALISTLFMSPLSNAGTPVEFVSQDWQVVCDNTRTCRLAGYQDEKDSEFPVSILLTRQAGANAQVEGKVKLGSAKNSSTKALMQLGNRHRMSLFINNKDLGETQPLSTISNDASLTSAQVQALLDALTQSSTIELVFRNSRWQLSDKGATAVMSKADEAQGRVGSASALVSSGTPFKSNNEVFVAKPAPTLRMVQPITKSSKRNKKFMMRSSQLAALMKDTLKDAEKTCPNLSDDSPWRIIRLNSNQLLAKHDCWSTSYNSGTGVWIINDQKPYEPKLVTTVATNFDKGKLTSIQKGRSIGDCLTKIEWVWTGKRFSKSYEGTTGLCRMIEADGAWQLPTYVTDVKISR